MAGLRVRNPIRMGGPTYASLAHRGRFGQSIELAVALSSSLSHAYGRYCSSGKGVSRACLCPREGTAVWPPSSAQSTHVCVCGQWSVVSAEASAAELGATLVVCVCVVVLVVSVVKL